MKGKNGKTPNLLRKIEEKNIDFSKDFDLSKEFYFARRKLNVIHRIHSTTYNEATLVLDPKQPDKASQKGVIVSLAASNVDGNAKEFCILFSRARQSLFPLSLKADSICNVITPTSFTTKSIACLAIDKESQTYSYTFINKTKFSKNDLPAALEHKIKNLTYVIDLTKFQKLEQEEINNQSDNEFVENVV